MNVKKIQLDLNLINESKTLNPVKQKEFPGNRLKKDLEEKWGPFDEDSYRKQVEAERLDKEQYHSDVFVAISLFEELIKKLYTDFREYIKKDIAENTWKYKGNNT